MIHLLTAVGLTPGGSSTIHIYKQTIHRTTHLKTLVGRLSGIRTQIGHTNLEECGPCAVFESYTLAFVLKMRKKHENKPQSARKTLSIYNMVCWHASVWAVWWIGYCVRESPIHVKHTILYTGCPRRNGQNFGRVFLMLKYTDITQNTYIQSWTVTEIMAIEKCGLLGGPRSVSRLWRHTHPLRIHDNETS